ncbi:MAG: UDP-N-acetylmuramate dehydrogenase [Gammaproteobacteria bacterium]|nr:UDP-N-acetylmuramate dehydrogenase [Gammaproteobacteria bacterium]MBT8134576.1 UDP-N-acetylmuramate dehydrogenase [Gammaproteobacteria bacterium]NNJ50632.1 UDP-N-acetylmuramate dehydrogenase [Gammaproteobacteria bacterium]
MSAMKKIEEVTVKDDEPMSRHTSWRAGGVARHYVQAQSLTALASYIAALDKDEDILWLGLGSNLLVRDGGFDGTVIATQGVMTQLAIVDESGIDDATVYVGAGIASAKLARFCSKHGLVGAEFFAGIPGLVGGALAMNAGAFGGETWSLVIEVETMNRQGEIKRRAASEFEYGYRSVKGLADEWFVSATLRLKKKPVAGNTVDIKQLLAKRAASQPTGVASCGSVFWNPEGHYAAQLIENCQLKGKRIGGAVVSQKHANFIINDNDATAEDIESLILLVQKTVKDETGILLHPEVKIVGNSRSGDSQR